MGKSNFYKPKPEETRRYDSILEEVERRARKVSRYEPEQLDVERNKYTNKLPKRPNVPKLPKLKIPGGMSTSRVANPSGRPGTIKTYKPKGDYKKAYKNLPSKVKSIGQPKKTKTKSKAKMDFPAKTTKYSPYVSAPGIQGKVKNTDPFSKKNTTSKAPGVTGGVRPVPKKPFGKGATKYAPGASTGPAPKKKNSSPFSSKK